MAACPFLANRAQNTARTTLNLFYPAGRGICVGLAARARSRGTNGSLPPSHLELAWFDDDRASVSAPASDNRVSAARKLLAFCAALTGQMAHRVREGGDMRPLTKRMRLLSIVVAAGLTLGLVGTAAAVTSRHSPAAPYKACSNAKKVLSVEVHGKCPAGTVLVKLGAKGAPGAKGAAGANGAAGPAGARGATGASGTLSNNTGLTVAGPLVVTGASTLAKRERNRNC